MLSSWVEKSLCALEISIQTFEFTFACTDFLRVAHFSPGCIHWKKKKYFRTEKKIATNEIGSVRRVKTSNIADKSNCCDSSLSAAGSLIKCRSVYWGAETIYDSTAVNSALTRNLSRWNSAVCLLSLWSEKIGLGLWDRRSFSGLSIKFELITKLVSDCWLKSSKWCFYSAIASREAPANWIFLIHRHLLFTAHLKAIPTTFPTNIWCDYQFNCRPQLVMQSPLVVEQNWLAWSKLRFSFYVQFAEMLREENRFMFARSRSLADE